MVSEVMKMGYGLQGSFQENISLSFLHVFPLETFLSRHVCAGRMMKGRFAFEQGVNYLSLTQQLLSHYS